jgi:hypothetical protein
LGEDKPAGRVVGQATNYNQVFQSLDGWEKKVFSSLFSNCTNLRDVSVQSNGENPVFSRGFPRIF